MDNVYLDTYYGPSPRAWGLQRIKAPWMYHRRSIPTCVGFTMYEVAAGHTLYGPSPRAWGLHIKAVDGLDLRRSIPTCVGFTPAILPRIT